MQKTIIRRTSTTDSALTGLSPLLQRIYAARGVAHVDELERGLEKLIPHTALLNITAAVQILYRALQQQQHIIIIGDFDVDGATSTALAVQALQSFGATRVSYLVPNRFTYGYGLTPEIVRLAAQQQPQLIITVDNGISSHAGVECAKELGIQVLITDHHLPGATLPVADVIVNPNQPGDLFPSKNLAGVGVIFYVMLALRGFLREQKWFAEKQLTEPNMAQLLDLVALGTIADVVPLDKNNRILVHQGLSRIRAGKVRPGIQALLTVAGRVAKNLSASDLGFALAPRLNAAGRLDDMSLGIACLLSLDEQKTLVMAKELDQLNQERQTIEVGMQVQAQKILQNLQVQRQLPFGLTLFDAQWHQGVIGILAGRLKEQFHRPVIVFAPFDDQTIKGSARSIPGIHIRDILDEVAARHPELINKFGGHAMAAGLSLPRENYAAFKTAFDTVIRERAPAELFQSVIYSDGELDTAEFKIEVAELLQHAGPWGQGFQEPLFDGIFQVVEQRLLKERHLKLLLKPMQSEQLLNAIAFNIDSQHWPNHRCQKIKAVYKLAVNHFREQYNLQLMLEYFTPVA